jgi:Flp pilus assembly protein TadG
VEVEMVRSVRDRGHVGVVVVMIATVLFVAMSSATVGVGGRLLDRARAQTAADAAALAAFAGGRERAATIAQRHGASLVSFVREPGDGRVTVVVRRGTASALAVATDAP